MRVGEFSFFKTCGTISTRDEMERRKTHKVVNPSHYDPISNSIEKAVLRPKPEK